MIGQSGILAIFGMSIVFGFLAIMIIAVTIMGKLLHTRAADAQAQAAVPTGNAGEVIAAITASVNEYRKK
jgi:oxaloacetate decarboxylase gamma subunit